MALLLSVGDPAGRSPGEARAGGIGGPPERQAEAIRRLGAAGIDHVQLVLDPIDDVSIERAAELLPLVR